MSLREAAQQATPREQLLKELMDSRVPKTEREHAAAQEIERLRAALAEDVTETNFGNMAQGVDSTEADHIGDANKMVATIKDNLTVEPVAYVTGYSKGYATVRPIDPCLLMCVGMALYRSPPTINEMETVEPVAWQWLDTAHFRKNIPADATPSEWRPVYTAPQKHKPLTDDEIHDCFQQKHKDKVIERRMISRAIERAHGIVGDE